ncbi:MAG: hypothetical protein LBT80_00760 [Lactobacillaceae bacterium]|jgi:hypothetical protein|nr:hypothetical protein [Lactobacillaceae bacterium]
MKMNRIEEFNQPVLNILDINGDGEKKFYVYALVDPRPNKGKVFYIGKGTENRIFSHEHEADGTDRDTPKLNTIHEIENANMDVQRYIISWGLTEKEAFAAENALINAFNLLDAEQPSLSNAVEGHGNRGATVEEFIKKHDFKGTKLSEWEQNALANKIDLNSILLVKIRDAFILSSDENQDYNIENQDLGNLKARTLGDWTVGVNRIKSIKYVVGIATGHDNAVVSAYEVDSETESIIVQGQKKRRTRWHSKTNKADTLKFLRLENTNFPEISFGQSSFTYMDNQLKMAEEKNDER